MKTYGIVGQSAWFAFGAWVGAAICILLDAICITDIKNHSFLDGESGMEILLVGYVLIAVVLAMPFAVWLWLRAGRRKQAFQSPWIVPFILGVIYLPSLSGAIPLLIKVTGQGRGARIGWAICACIFGLPVVSSELSLRLAKRGQRNNERKMISQ